VIECGAPWKVRQAAAAETAGFVLTVKRCRNASWSSAPLGVTESQTCAFSIEARLTEHQVL
jgi:hypothetical protein